MPAQAWIGIGTVAFAGGLLLVAIWRGFSISKISLFGMLEFNLPNPIVVRPHRLAAIPAVLLLVAGVGALGIGSYRKVIPPSQTVTIAATPNSHDDGQTASVASFRNVNVTFLNKTNERVNLYWIDFYGAAQPPTVIFPGGSTNVDTFTGHLWVAKTQRGVELLRYVVKSPWW